MTDHSRDKTGAPPFSVIGIIVLCMGVAVMLATLADATTRKLVTIQGRLDLANSKLDELLYRIKIP